MRHQSKNQIKMKHLCILVIAITFLSATAVAQKKVLSTSVEKSGLKGHIKSIQWDKDVFFEYDKVGNLTTETAFNKDGSIKTIGKYKYSKPGLLTELTTYDNSNNIIEKRIYEYNANDYEIQSTTYDGSNKLKKKRVYEYDANNYEIKSTDYDNEGKITYQTTRNYLDKHHYISNDIIDGKPYKTDTVTTDTNNNITEIRRTNYNSNVYFRKLFSYKTGMSSPYLEQHFDDKGKLYLEIQNDFDKKGNVIKHVEKGSGQIQTTTSEFTYDSKDNWTKEIASGHNSGTYEQTIKYY